MFKIFDKTSGERGKNVRNLGVSKYLKKLSGGGGDVGNQDDSINIF